jgi:hypothetical protein
MHAGDDSESQFSKNSESVGRPILIVNDLEGCLRTRLYWRWGLFLTCIRFPFIPAAAILASVQRRF